MAIASITCPKCSAPLPQELWNQPAPSPCPACANPVLVQVFPALRKPVVTGQAPETILIEGEAGCFYHPQKRAVVPCVECGRFLCALCDVEINDRHLCPGCLETARRKRSLVELDHGRTLYDSSALVLALGPLLLCWPVSILTAPAAIYVAFLSFRRPGSIIQRTRARAYLAIVFAVLQLVGWSLGLSGFFGSF
jgi:hypothetical protein